MKRQTKLIWALLLTLVAIIFVLLNTEPVTINFGFVQPRMPLIIVLVIMVLIGAVLAWVLARRDWPEKQKDLQDQLQASRKQNQSQKQEISQLKEQLAAAKAEKSNTDKSE